MPDHELHEWWGRGVADWKQDWGVPTLRVFRTVGSTNDVAAEMAGEGAAEGTVVLADEQTAGRGRLGRAWSAPAGSSLSLSMVLRPGHRTGRLLTLRLGLAAARGIERVLPLSVGLKWPNDLVVRGRKVAGILCEARSTGERVDHVVAGIGVNLRQQDDDWPPELRGRATSLAAAAGRPVETPAVAGAVVAEWRAAAAQPALTLSPEEREAFRRRDVLFGQPVRVDGRPAGLADGINPDGALRIQGGEGAGEIIAGTVRVYTPEGG